MGVGESNLESTAPAVTREKLEASFGELDGKQLMQNVMRGVKALWDLTPEETARLWRYVSE